MDRLIRIMYDLYVGDTNNDGVFDDETYDDLTGKLVDLEKKLKAMLKQGSNSKKDIDQIVDDFFFTNNALSSLYRYYDFEQGFITGMAIGMMKSKYLSSDYMSELINKLNKIKKFKNNLKTSFILSYIMKDVFLSFASTLKKE